MSIDTGPSVSPPYTDIKSSTSSVSYFYDESETSTGTAETNTVQISDGTFVYPLFGAGGSEVDVSINF